MRNRKNHAFSHEGEIYILNTKTAEVEVYRANRDP